MKGKVKSKNALNEVRKLQKIAGLLKENSMDGIQEESEHSTPNLDVGEIGLDSMELEDMFLEYENLNTFPGAERLEDIEEKLRRKLPKIFTFVIGGNFSEADSVYDIGDGSVVYEEGYDGLVVVYKKKDLMEVVRKLKEMGAKPYDESAGEV